MSSSLTAGYSACRVIFVGAGLAHLQKEFGPVHTTNADGILQDILLQVTQPQGES